MNFKDSKTYQNVLKAYEGESKANTKYQIYGHKAKDEGYEQIGDIFDETAGNEREHAEIMMKLLDDGEIPSTLENLEDAFGGEYNEWTNVYPEFAKIAKEEGFEDIARLFREISRIEQHHEYRFKMLASNIKNDKVFCKNMKIVWICMNCGNIYYAECAPEKCPVCGYPQGYYKVNCENY